MELITATHYPMTWEMLLRLVISCACGFLIGMERSKRFKEAGIRTHIIACCASALFMLVSKYGFVDLDGISGAMKTADPARIAAGVVTGVSFLCAGVIFRVGGSVHGLTTAVGLWLTAAVGLSIGAGMYGLGLFATVLIILFQALLHHITFGHDSFLYNNVKVTVDTEFDFSKLKELIINKTNGVIEDVSAVHNTEMSAYEFVLRTRGEVEAEDWIGIMRSDPAIISISHKSMAKS